MSLLKSHAEGASSPFRPHHAGTSARCSPSTFGNDLRSTVHRARPRKALVPTRDHLGTNPHSFQFPSSRCSTVEQTSTGPPPTQECPDCHALAADLEAHKQWHSRLVHDIVTAVDRDVRRRVGAQQPDRRRRLVTRLAETSTHPTGLADRFSAEALREHQTYLMGIDQRVLNGDLGS